MRAEFNLSLVIAFKKRNYLLARKLRVDRQLAIRKINHRIGASTAFAGRCLQGEHVRWQEVGEQTLQAGLAELPAQMREFEKII